MRSLQTRSSEKRTPPFGFEAGCEREAVSLIEGSRLGWIHWTPAKPQGSDRPVRSGSLCFPFSYLELERVASEKMSPPLFDPKVCQLRAAHPFLWLRHVEKKRQMLISSGFPLVTKLFAQLTSPRVLIRSA